MPAQKFDAFKAELEAVRVSIASLATKTVRDDEVRDRVRALFRTWTWTVAPAIGLFVQNSPTSLKLGAELEALAKITSKRKSVEEYRKRLGRAIQLTNEVVLLLPPSGRPKLWVHPAVAGELFVPGIPDVPASLVPNALTGWRTNIEAFVEKYPFDQSVFMMIRFRTRNDDVVRQIKKGLSSRGYRGVLASEHNVTDDLYNPIACLLCCARGIAVFDQPETGQEFNPNVAYELGMLHLLGRDCLILKHHGLQSLQTDLLMKLYREYTTPENAGQRTLRWIEELQS